MRDNLPEIKQRQIAAWNSAIGYHRLARHFLPAIERLLDLLSVGASDQVLDVAAGTGMATIAARQRGAAVIGQDLAPLLLSEARHYAGNSGFPDISFEQSDVEDLAYPQGSFTVVFSNFGVIHAPRGDVAGGEIERVLASSGRIGITTWAEDCPLHDIPQIMAKYVAPEWLPADTRSWGNYRSVRRFISQRFVPDLDFEEGQINIVYPDATQAWNDWRRNYGPFRYVYERLTAGDRQALDQDMMAFFGQWVDSAGEVSWQLPYLIFHGVKISSLRLIG